MSPQPAPPDEALRQPEVHDRAHVVLAARVLRDAHRPDEHRARRASASSRRTRASRHASSPPPRSSASQSAARAAAQRVLEARRVCASIQVLVLPALLDDVPQRAREEREVAADVHLEEAVGDLRAEHRALRDRRDPVALHARLAVRVDAHHPRAVLLGVVRGTSSMTGWLFAGFAPMKTTRSRLDDVAGTSRSSPRRRSAPSARRCSARGRCARRCRVELAPSRAHRLLRGVVRLVRHAAAREERGDPVGRRRADPRGDERRARRPTRAARSDDAPAPAQQRLADAGPARAARSCARPRSARGRRAAAPGPAAPSCSATAGAGGCCTGARRRASSRACPVGAERAAVAAAVAQDAVGVREVVAAVATAFHSSL